MTLHAISPLLATNSLSKGGLSLLPGSVFDAEAADILRHAKACELMARVVPRSLHLANIPSWSNSCSNLPAKHKPAAVGVSWRLCWYLVSANKEHDVWREGTPRVEKCNRGGAGGGGAYASELTTAFIVSRERPPQVS